MGIIFHSGSYDRIYHGLSLAIVGVAMDRDVKLFFTYWALEYLKKDFEGNLILDSEGEKYSEIIGKNFEDGHMEGVAGYLKKIKAMGGMVFVCSASMEMLEIKSEDLIDEIDKVMGIATFMSETEGYQMLFI